MWPRQPGRLAFHFAMNVASHPRRWARALTISLKSAALSAAPSAWSWRIPAEDHVAEAEAALGSGVELVERAVLAAQDAEPPVDTAEDQENKQAVRIALSCGFTGCSSTEGSSRIEPLLTCSSSVTSWLQKAKSLFIINIVAFKTPFLCFQ